MREITSLFLLITAVEVNALLKSGHRLLSILVTFIRLLILKAICDRFFVIGRLTIVNFVSIDSMRNRLVAIVRYYAFFLTISQTRRCILQAVVNKTVRIVFFPELLCKQSGLCSNISRVPTSPRDYVMNRLTQTINTPTAFYYPHDGKP